KTDQSACYRCGKKGHWANVCRTSKHFVELYQASLNDKGKDAEINFIDQSDPICAPTFDVSDFFIDPVNETMDNNIFGEGQSLVK
ncbi:C2HC-type zinc finger protein, partial [Dyella mobilis]|uniref:C2HC-type zinc finger protein n=1 Tax=Dyella mobilis TaxID=1849582 RepID=UPI0024E0CC59